MLRDTSDGTEGAVGHRVGHWAAFSSIVERLMKAREEHDYKFKKGTHSTSRMDPGGFCGASMTFLRTR